MRKRIFSLFLLPLLLSSCNKKEDYSLDGKKDFQLCRNGDLLSYEFNEETSYEDLGNGLDQSSLDFTLGEGVSFIYTLSSCHVCLDFKTTFVSFIKETLLDIHVLNSPYAFANYLISYFGNDNIEKDESHPFCKQTPTWYHASEKGGVKIANWGWATSANLKKNIYSSASICNIYKFSSISKLKKGLENATDSLIFYLDYSNDKSVSFYREYLFPLAKVSAKKTFLIDSKRLPSAEKNIAQDFFGENNIIIENKKETLEESSSAISFIQNYYR